MPRTFRSALLVSLLAAAGCSDALSPGDEAALSAVSAGGEVRMENSAARPVYYTLFERETSALVLWGACADPQRCARVEPGATVRVQHGQIHGYEAGKSEAVVYWWHLVPGPGPTGFVPDGIRSLVVRL